MENNLEMPPEPSHEKTKWILFPWDKDDAKPYFVNPEGFEWWSDKFCTEWARKDAVNGNKGLKNVEVFFIRKDGKYLERVLINNIQEILYRTELLESMCIYLDMLKFDEMSRED